MATITTNDPNGLGYQTGIFTLPIGQNVSAAFSGRISANKVYRAAYNSNIIEECTMSTWLDEYGGVEFDCHPTYTLLEYSGFRYQIKQSGATTIPANPATGTITLSTKDHFVGGAYYLPIVGNTIVLPPSGVLAEVTAVTHSGANTTTLTVRQRGSSSITIADGTEMMVVPGMILTDCQCPTGQFRIPDLPIEHDLSMIDVADKGVLCGDDLEACMQFKIPFFDANGNEISDKSAWFTPSQQEMYRGIERKKNIERLLNPVFGLIPTIKARGIKFTPAANDVITIDDIRDLKKALASNGVNIREFAFFAGTDKFSQWMQMLGMAGVSQLNYMERPLNDCSWINMQYCGIQVEGLTIHVYEDCSFGNGKGLGAAGYNFANAAIGVPLGNRPLNVKYSFGTPNRNGGNGRNFTTVYFESIQGRKYDMVTDSNGMLGPRNSFGTGCKNHEWTVESRFTFEIYNANAYIWDSL